MWGKKPTHGQQAPSGRLQYYNLHILIYVFIYSLYRPQRIHLNHYYNGISLLNAFTSFALVSRGYCI